jgi:enoyl-CoA hydratase/carnithine racemase
VEDMDTVVLDRQGTWAWLRLNRPDRLNALTDGMLERLDAVVDEINADRSIRCIVLTGNGRAFCAGRDTAEIGAVREAAYDVPPLRGHQTNRIADIEVPVVAAVNGAAVGGGMGMALMADVIYAADTSFFVDGHLAAELCPSSAAWWLPRQISYQRAMEIFLSGRRVYADEARDIGLVTAVVTGDKLEATVAEVAAGIAERSRPTLTRTKRAVRHALGTDWNRAIEQIGYLRALETPEAS